MKMKHVCSVFYNVCCEYEQAKFGKILCLVWLDCNAQLFNCILVILLFARLEL